MFSEHPRKKLLYKSMLPSNINQMMEKGSEADTEAKTQGKEAKKGNKSTQIRNEKHP